MKSAASRLVWWALIVGGLVFAVQGGEFGTTDLLRQRSRRQALQTAIDSLRREVDSLASYKRALQTDPVLQERIAREEFGMVRGEKELLYRLAPPRADSAAESKGRR